MAQHRELQCTDLMMPDQRQNKDDREWNSQQPEQRTSTETHVSLHLHN
jgi:hypothetical protein